MPMVAYTADRGLCLCNQSKQNANAIVPIKYDLQISESNYNPEKVLSFPDLNIQISNIEFFAGKIVAKFVKFEGCKTENIDVKGDVLVQYADGKIEEIKATGNIYLFACPEVNKIVSTSGKIFITHLSLNSPNPCKYTVDQGEVVHQRIVNKATPKPPKCEFDKYKKIII